MKTACSTVYTNMVSGRALLDSIVLQCLFHTFRSKKSKKRSVKKSDEHPSTPGYEMPNVTALPDRVSDQTSDTS